MHFSHSRKQPDLRVQARQRAGRAGRTRPGKCFRLYPSLVYEDVFLDATIPEIQRSSLAGTVLYLKSLDLPDIDILKFDFLDPPSGKKSFIYLLSVQHASVVSYIRIWVVKPWIALAAAEALEDALKQLYLIDAIDEDGSITSLGRTMAGKKWHGEEGGGNIFLGSLLKCSTLLYCAELPLEPSLSRTLLEANECGCLSQALTVAAMLSAESTLLLGQRYIFNLSCYWVLKECTFRSFAKFNLSCTCSKSTDKKRKHVPSNLPDGSGWGDHIQLLQIYELWHQTDYNTDWCKEKNLQVLVFHFCP